MNIPKTFLDSITQFRWLPIQKKNEIIDINIILKLTIHKSKFNKNFCDYLFNYFINDNETNETLIAESFNTDYYITNIDMNLLSESFKVIIKINNISFNLENILKECQNILYDTQQYNLKYYMLNNSIIECNHTINLLKYLTHYYEFQPINHDLYNITNENFINSRNTNLNNYLKNIQNIREHQFVLYNYLDENEKKIEYISKKDCFMYKDLDKRGIILNNNNGCDIDLIMIMLMNDRQIFDYSSKINLIVCNNDRSSEIESKLKRFSKLKYTVIKNNRDLSNLCINNIIVVEFNKLYNLLDKIKKCKINDKFIFNRVYFKDVKCGKIFLDELKILSNVYYIIPNTYIHNFNSIIDIIKYKWYITKNSTDFNKSKFRHSNNILFKILISNITNYFEDLIVLKKNKKLMDLYKFRGKYYNISNKSNKSLEIDKDFIPDKYWNSNLVKIMIIKNIFKYYSKNIIYIDEEYIYKYLNPTINTIKINYKPGIVNNHIENNNYFINYRVIKHIENGNLRMAFENLNVQNYKYTRLYLQSLEKIHEDIIIENDSIPNPLKEKYGDIISRLDNTECNICLEPLNNGKTFLNCCHNVYCFECLIYSLSYQKSCPMCRQDIKKNCQFNCLQLDLENIDSKKIKNKKKQIEQIIESAKQNYWHKVLDDIITFIKGNNEDHKILICNNYKNNSIFDNEDFESISSYYIIETLKDVDIKCDEIGKFYESDTIKLYNYRNKLDSNCIICSNTDFILYANNYNYFNKTTDVIMINEDDEIDKSRILGLLNPYTKSNINIWYMNHNPYLILE